MESKFKTQLCNYYKAGHCPNGRSCTFAHGHRELNLPDHYKTQLCRHYPRGTCTYGDDCMFAHGAEELRDFDEPQDAPTPVVRKILTKGEEPPITEIVPLASGKSWAAVVKQEQRSWAEIVQPGTIRPPSPGKRNEYLLSKDDVEGFINNFGLLLNHYNLNSFFFHEAYGKVLHPRLDGVACNGHSLALSTLLFIVDLARGEDSLTGEKLMAIPLIQQIAPTTAYRALWCHLPPSVVATIPSMKEASYGRS